MRCNFLSNRFVGLNQGAAIGVLDGTLLGEKTAELSQASSEALLLAQTLHFTLDSNDFGAADLKDLLGRRIRAGLRLDQIFVPGPAVWQLRECDGIARRAEILVFEKGDEPAIGGHESFCSMWSA